MTGKAAPLLDPDPTGVVPGVPDPGIREMQMVPTVAPGIVGMFERLAKDPSVDPDKLEKLMNLQERVIRHDAEAMFNGAMTEAQKEIRPIAADADNPQTRSRYASYSQLDRALRPIYTRHGFGLSFDTGDAAPDYVRVLCYVTHTGGHARTYRADMPADGKGAKGGDVMTKTHAVGSAMSYGMRYLLKMIFNVAVGEDDDDGNAASARPQPPSNAPAGYDAWFATLEGVADGGMAEWEKAWQASPEEYRMYLARTAPKMLASLKTKASKVRR